MSICPAITVIKLGSFSSYPVNIHKRIVTIIRVELMGLVVLPLLAIVMSQGYGLS
ncbi:hypothetical protein GCM10011352_42360 [Marinobacterium zhoushanense]|uniref:Uncharacterized protein n=1 Tax=Marinobacterium zhoushanense TaxID=1679163 RepID=A0ABQ1KY80_9GAMM|nr:hypothetical protein GCM10011352_42360 [Marinobacterium zhoushanense]